MKLWAWGVKQAVWGLESAHYRCSLAHSMALESGGEGEHKL